VQDQVGCGEHIAHGEPIGQAIKRGTAKRQRRRISQKIADRRRRGLLQQLRLLRRHAQHIRGKIESDSVPLRTQEGQHFDEELARSRAEVEHSTARGDKADRGATPVFIQIAAGQSVPQVITRRQILKHTLDGRGREHRNAKLKVRRAKLVFQL
jgi:hypothetical protein